MRWIRCSVGVGLIAAVSLSGAVATASVAAKTPQACTLFTSAIATTALGGPVNPAQQTKPNPNTTICKYSRADGQAFGDVQVSPWSFLSEFSLAGQTNKKVRGVGDKAYDLGSTFGVAVKKGSVGFIVDLSLAVGDFNGAAATQLQAAETAADIATAKQIVASLSGKKKR